MKRSNGRKVLAGAGTLTASLYAATAVDVYDDHRQYKLKSAPSTMHLSVAGSECPIQISLVWRSLEVAGGAERVGYGSNNVRLGMLISFPSYSSSSYFFITIFDCLLDRMLLSVAATGNISFVCRY
ncbi:unnamed protein product [Ceratitis capitata]|uniref:(Mediterranean fruit fly) hypothetical protein n=1 Tax=Ceratitis capitata TaxID=7213 RepID=A0A811UE60_CERCA|nr:unnamed protein product [Ceratitis capitata]